MPPEAATAWRVAKKGSATRRPSRAKGARGGRRWRADAATLRLALRLTLRLAAIRLLVLARPLALALVLPLAVPAATDAQSRRVREDSRFWIASAGALLVAAALDERARSASLRHRSTDLDRLASAGNAMGTGRNLIAAMAASYVGARLLGRREAADDVLRVGAAYAVSNAIVGILKPMAGRHRPGVPGENDAWRFDPFSTRGEWHSLPSSHAVHAVSVAAAATMVSRNRWVGAAGYSAAALVGWSRVYDDQHWASDVAVSGIIGIAASALTLELTERWW